MLTPHHVVPDAPLTALGKKQAAALASRIPDLQDKVQLVVSSPLQRTLQTTLLGWGPAVKRLGISTVVCLPEAQECNDFPCDTGSSRAELEKIPEFDGFDFRHLTPEWTSKTGFWSPAVHSIANRAKAVRHFLRERPETEIVVVAHGDILRQITSHFGGPSDYLWRNAEVRVFTFDPSTFGKDECFLQLHEVIDAARGYVRTSTEMEFDSSGSGKL